MPIVPEVPDFSSGLSSSTQMQQLADAVSFALGPPIAQMRQIVAQTITNATLTSITFTAEDVDTDVDGTGGHSTSVNTSRFVARYPGWYVCAGGISYAASAVGSRLCDFNVNGIAANGGRVWLPAHAAVNAIAARSVKVYLAIGDFVELVGYQTSGGNLDTAVTGAEQSLFNVWWQRI